MPEEKMSGLSDDSKLFGALAYIFGILSGILVFLLKKEDKYAKFNAMQSILLGVVVFVLFIGLGIVSVVAGVIPVIGWVVALVLGLVNLLLIPVVFLLVLFLMWKAYSGEKFKLPILGAQAEKMAG